MYAYHVHFKIAICGYDWNTNRFYCIIPVVGAYVGTAIGAIMVLTESPMQAIIFVIIILAIQLVEGNVIYPKIMGNSIGLPGIWVLAAEL